MKYVDGIVHQLSEVRRLHTCNRGLRLRRREIIDKPDCAGPTAGVESQLVHVFKRELRQMKTHTDTSEKETHKSGIFSFLSPHLCLCQWRTRAFFALITVVREQMPRCPRVRITRIDVNHQRDLSPCSEGMPSSPTCSRYSMTRRFGAARLIRAESVAVSDTCRSRTPKPSRGGKTHDHVRARASSSRRVRPWA